MIIDKNPPSGSVAGTHDSSACASVYVPIVVAYLPDIANGLNYPADTSLLGGSVLALAGALDEDLPLVHQLQ